MRSLFIETIAPTTKTMVDQVNNSQSSVTREQPMLVNVETGTRIFADPDNSDWSFVQLPNNHTIRIKTDYEVIVDVIRPVSFIRSSDD